MSRPVVLVGHAHVCPIHGPGTVVSGSDTVKLHQKPVARIGDLISCGARIVTGSPTVSIDGSRPVARQGDTTDHGGTLIEGDPDWLLE